MWSRQVQDVIFAILFHGWLGGSILKKQAAEQGKLLTIEEVGEILNGESVFIGGRHSLAVFQRL
jgi:hypothetical protein